jgi:hypothetical protein
MRIEGINLNKQFTIYKGGQYLLKYKTKQLVNNLKEIKYISFVALLALFSFMPVFSASSNLAYLGHGTGNFGLFGKTFGAYLYRFSDNLWRT